MPGGVASHAELTEAIIEGAVLRQRPKLMTGLALLLGLIPILYSTGSGADVMKRIAALRGNPATTGRGQPA